jgi:hypothetical protein
MHAATFTKRFRNCADALQTRDRVYRSANLWSNVGRRPLDSRLSTLADLYWDAAEDQRQKIRDAVDPRLTWELIAYIRRVAILIEGKTDVQWLRRGLAIAAIENGRDDFRDLIVSLVILRHGAERVGIKTRKHFNDTLKVAAEEVHDTLKNARDHRESDVRITVREFGPPQWCRVRTE